jgi:hypothetical protein
MATMPEETRRKIGEGVRRAYESPSVRARLSASTRRRWTPEYRKEFAKRMREVWRQRKARETQGDAKALA